MVLLPLEEAGCGSRHVRYDVLRPQQRSLMTCNAAGEQHVQLMPFKSNNCDGCCAVLMINKYRKPSKAAVEASVTRISQQLPQGVGESSSSCDVSRGGPEGLA